MKKGIYQEFTKEQLILRDHLALDRTRLANENTLLSYVRTSLALLAGGGTLLHFLNEIYFDALGILLIILGVISLIVGIIRYRQMDKDIKAIRNK